MVPQNPFAAAAQGDLLPLIIAVCVFGAAATTMREEKRALLSLRRRQRAVLVVIGCLMRLAPFGGRFLIASPCGDRARRAAAAAGFAPVVVAALAVHVAVVLVPLLQFGRGWAWSLSFRRCPRAAVRVLDRVVECDASGEHGGGARSRRRFAAVASFVLPAARRSTRTARRSTRPRPPCSSRSCTAWHLRRRPGGHDRDDDDRRRVCGRGRPGSSLVTTLIVLNAIGLGPKRPPDRARAGIDRPLDMCRTAVNTIGNLVGAAVVARGKASGFACSGSTEAASQA